MIWIAFVLAAALVALNIYASDDRKYSRIAGLAALIMMMVAPFVVIALLGGKGTAASDDGCVRYSRLAEDC